MQSRPGDRQGSGRWEQPEDSHTCAGRQTASLAALALSLGLIVAGLFLVKALREPDVQDDHTLVAAVGAEQ
jgi:hypothetical protein